MAAARAEAFPKARPDPAGRRRRPDLGAHGRLPRLRQRLDQFQLPFAAAALDEHPVALVRTFATRLRESEYGWAPLRLAAPFNVSAALESLRRDYPEVTGVSDGVPQVPRGARLRKANPSLYEERMAAYLQRYQQIPGRPLHQPLRSRRRVLRAQRQREARPLRDQGLRPARRVPPHDRRHPRERCARDRPLRHRLALTAMPLWRSRRPARTWLKLIAWPTLASTLVWAAIFVMAVSAALFGGLTPNTSALALFASLPLLSMLASCRCTWPRPSSPPRPRRANGTASTAARTDDPARARRRSPARPSRLGRLLSYWLGGESLRRRGADPTSPRLRRTRRSPRPTLALSA